MPYTDAEVGDLLNAHFARIGKALASPHRIVLLDLLAQGEKTVETLADRANFSIKNTSAHLKALREARLVETRRQGTYINYRLADPSVARFLHALRDLARERLAEVDRLVRDQFEQKDLPAAISAAEFRDGLGEDRWTILDLRRRDEYDAGHVPGALSIPAATLADAVAGVPRKKPIVVYCRGPFCTHPTDAAKALKAQRTKVFRLDGGYSGWLAADAPVETSGPTG